MVHTVRRKYSCPNNIVQIFSNEQEDDTKTLQMHSDTELCAGKVLWSMVGATQLSSVTLMQCGSVSPARPVSVSICRHSGL